MSSPAELRVRGSAQREVAPDYAIVQVTLSAQDRDRGTALAGANALLEQFRGATQGHDDIRSSRMSNIRVAEDYRWNPETSSHEAIGWVASLSGSVEAETDSVPDVVGRLADTGAQIGYLDWRLESDNPTFREVRNEAVADAERAAGDFAAALGRQLGDLRVLADAGLLGGETPARTVPMMARAMSGDAAGGAPIDVDPAPQMVTAGVEATFELR